MPQPLTAATLGQEVTLPLGATIEDLERFWVLSTLAALDGNRSECARQLGVALRTVRNKISEYRAQGFKVPPAKGRGARR